MKAIFCLGLTVILASLQLHAETAKDKRPTVVEVGPGIFRGPGPEGETSVQDWSKQGIRTVINMQGGDAKFSAVVPGESLKDRQQEGEWVKQNGMQYFNFPIRAAKKPSAQDRQIFLKIVAMMNDPSLQPVFIHCHEGADRTGGVVALYRILVQSCSYEQARTEMFQQGKVWTPLFDLPLESMLKDAERNRPQDTPKSCPLPSETAK